MATRRNVCRGLNHACGGHKGGDNKCAGTGSCATASAHSCHGSNDCKGEGGCGSNPGENACKGKGECGVPLGDKAWTKARANFESAMKAAGSTDKAKVRDEIEKISGFMGTAGEVNMSATEHLGLDLSAFRMLEIRNGTWKLLD